jgi:hypothetical protein
MFKILKYEEYEQLYKFVSEAERLLKGSVQTVNYPVELKIDGAISKWRHKYKEIDTANQNLFENISDKAGVYTLSTLDKDNNWEILYIGETQSKTAKQRIRSHIVWRNKETKSGKITGSQFDQVQTIIMAGKDLGFSFVEIQPAAMRHYIEENLIEKINPPWNKHKKLKNITTSLHRSADTTGAR